MKREKGGSNGNKNVNSGGFVPNSLRIISSCIKTVSTNAGIVASTVRSAGASVAASIATPPATDEKDQVLWAGFDKLELSPSSFKNVLLLGYCNGFQVLEIDDASDVHELVSKRDGAVTFLQVQPIPSKSEGAEGFKSLHPMLSIVSGDEPDGCGLVQGGQLGASIKDSSNELQHGNFTSAPTTVRFFSLRSNNYVHVLRFRSSVYIVRCSPRIVAVALAAQIYCFDPVTLVNKFSVLTYPIQGAVGINVGYGPMALGSRWLAYASNNPLISNSGRLSPQNLTPSPGVSPSGSPGSGSFVARYAMESSKQLAAGIINLGDMGYKTLSKYCQDILPDGAASPISPNSGGIIGRSLLSMHPNEADNPGMVVVKDFVSKDVISQFRAHNNPISSLCFDPSGTLLVTASVYGNNINIFRIMPKSTSSGSGMSHYDWSSSHVHLYKLYRGLTSAVIHDISFSSYSQWISIVSSRGTCHVYLLSPFGGDVSLRSQNISGEKPVLVPDISFPWWSSSSSVKNQPFSPPPLITLSVVGRIKNSNSGWLNTVSTAAASAAGKTPPPSGAVAAIFHNTMHESFREHNSKANSLEHLLVCSPSGHLIQHDLLPSAVESYDSSSITGSSSHFPLQDEELRVNAEPVQWWDVCRRSNWPERFECISSSTLDHHETSQLDMEISCNEESGVRTLVSTANALSGGDSTKALEKSRWYLSHAEVKSSSRQIPIWQKSKISFYVMSPPNGDKRFNIDCSIGEIEIEKLPIRDVEIKQKDLLPVFQHFHGSQPDCNDRIFSYGECSTTLSEVCRERNRSKVDTGIRCSGIISNDSLRAESSSNAVKVDFPELWQKSQSGKESDHHGAAIAGNLTDKDDSPCRRSLSMLSHIIPETMPISGQDSKSLDCSPSHVVGGTSTLDATVHESEDLSFSARAATDDLVSSNRVSCETTSSLPDSRRVEKMEDVNSHRMAGVGGYLQEGYCKLSDPDDCHDSTEAVTDGDSSCSHHDRDKPTDDGDSEDMLGGVFAFSEEG